MKRRPHLRRLASLTAVAVLALAASAPARSAASSALPDVEPTRAGGGSPGPSSTGSDCGGHASWFSVPDGLLNTRVDHELLVFCNRSAITIQGLSELHYDLDLDTTNGFSRGFCGPVTGSCLARHRSDPMLLGLPLRHRSVWTLTRTDGSIWTGDSSICTGAGTNVARCESNQVLTAGSSGRNDFG